MKAEVRIDGQALVVHLSGDWSLMHPPPRFGPLVAEGIAAGGGGRTEARAVDFDAAALGAWDSSLLAFLIQGSDYCETHELEFREDNLPEPVVRLLALARIVPERDVVPDADPGSRLARLGTRGVASYDAFMAAVTFAGEVVRGLGGVLVGRVRMNRREFWVVVQTNSSGALPIVTLIAFLVGMIISFLGAVVLRRFGADYFVSYLVGYGMLREMAALMTGIIMAGRTGAAFAAELGSMKITEEIDAFRTLGIHPIDHLVLPRVMGLLVTMPLLTVYASVVGILGGMVVAMTVLDLTPTQFAGGLLAAVTLSDAMLGVFKGTVFGLIIGVAGCMKGMQTGAGAGAVGRAATSAVVLGITLIIGANAVIDWLAVLLDV